MKEKYDVLFEKERLLSLAGELQPERFKPGYDNLTAESAEKKFGLESFLSNFTFPIGN